MLEPPLDAGLEATWSDLHGIIECNPTLHFREGIAIREVERRTGLSRNTIRKYLREHTVEPKFKAPD